jgi:hypothetical protein
MSMAPRFCPHAQAQAMCEKKSSKKVQFRHKSVRSFRTTRTQESGEESWKVLEVKYHQELIRELHKKKHCRSTFVQKHYCSKAKGQGRVGRGFAH